MQLSEDCTQVALDIQGRYEAPQLEALIHQLSSLRAAMEPPVPASPPAAARAEEDAAAARARGDPCVQVAVMRGGITRFWVRHGGLGWFAFNLPVERANLLAHVILETTSPHERVTALSQVKRRLSDLSH